MLILLSGLNSIHNILGRLLDIRSEKSKINIQADNLSAPACNENVF